MKKYKLFINRYAEFDLINSKAFYDNQKQDLGTAFLLEVKEVIHRIQNQPLQFPKIEKEARRANLNKFPFAIFFIVENEVINVFSIFHFSRNPEMWKNRIEND